MRPSIIASSDFNLFLKFAKVPSGHTWPPGDLATWPFLQVSPSSSGTKIQILIHGRKVNTKRIRFAPIRYCELRFPVFPKFANPPAPPGHLANSQFPMASPSTSGTKIQILMCERKTITKRIRFAPIHYCELRFTASPKFVNSPQSHLATWRPRHSPWPAQALQAPKCRFSFMGAKM